MAQLFKLDQVTPTWPAKNHASGACNTLPENGLNTINTTKPGISLSLLMADAVVLRQAIAARISTMDAVDTESIDEDALAELYDDRDALQRLQDDIKHAFAQAFGTAPPQADASYEHDLK
ncbi:hypothetical protein INH39_12875 [Massilia violaceinigra]|uniref:Uncharacterized protein n=1 Tax=Massilia violaceinigra TaxID=2045208 RepID=A0ABY4ACK0_9BURK|nr:hypothetical protein [Massilia violaceinigra]UOD32461.1 hypothetical protein INH39_12875 [Massilia violaceinigra]